MRGPTAAATVRIVDVIWPGEAAPNGLCNGKGMGCRSRHGLSAEVPASRGLRHAAGAMPLDAAFVDDCPYGPDGLLLDELIRVDREESLVVVRMPTTGDLPLTREQRNHPRFHPAHLSGGLMIHMTGMAGFVHAYYVLDLRHADGWIGYGARITNARFTAMATLGDPLIIECRATQVRRSASNVFARYEFRFHQNETLVYSGEQIALWLDMTKDQKAIPPL
jgi:hypothetical protein